MGGILIDESHMFKLTAQVFPNNFQAFKALKTLLLSPLTDAFFKGDFTPVEYGIEAEKKYGFNAAQVTQAITTLPEMLPAISYGIKILEKAKTCGYKTYLLTNVYPSVLTRLQNKHKFFSLFDGIMASCDMRQIKPNPEIYQSLIKKFSINPMYALFLDDKKNNIIAGSAQGIDGIVCYDLKKTYKFLLKNNILASNNKRVAQ